MNFPTDKRMDFVVVVDVTEGNPNGDPMRNNTPRTDPYDGHGLITDVCIKRKVRDYLTDEGQEMLITREPVSINDLLCQVAKTCDPPETKGKKDGGKKGKLGQAQGEVRAVAVCKRFIDARLFGAMAETGDCPAGRIRGPLQLSMGRSLHPVRISKHQVVRVAVTDDKELEKPGTMSDEHGRQIIRYAAYRMVGTYSPRMGAKTGVSADDLNLFFTALQRCWARDRASARGVMGCRGIWIAIHETEDGLCHASDTHNAVRVTMPATATSWDEATVKLERGQRGVTWHYFGWDGLELATLHHEHFPKAPVVAGSATATGAAPEGWGNPPQPEGW